MAGVRLQLGVVVERLLEFDASGFGLRASGKSEPQHRRILPTGYLGFGLRASGFGLRASGFGLRAKVNRNVRRILLIYLETRSLRSEARSLRADLGKIAETKTLDTEHQTQR